MQSGQPITSTEEFNSASKIRPVGFANSLLDRIKRHPRLAIALVALLAVVINNYPILFCGKSYVSPMSVGTLVYNWWPPLPGMTQWPQRTPDILPSEHGSDTEAMMWWGVPVGFIESRSLLEHGEIPLWNRYNHAGETLIGQALCMLGDPLQWIVIFGHGSAWAWDVKFLAAKFLFCCGFGLLILRLLGNQFLAVIYAALAAYCGAFFFINNHMVFFVFCYAPWILLAAIEWTDGRSDRSVGWGLIWLLANFACFNAGHVEVAVALIGGLNLSAMIHTLTGCRNALCAAKVLGRMGLVTLLFLGLTAPVWISFLVSLQDAFTAHEGVSVLQLPATFLPGAFDDLFYLRLRPNESIAAYAPGTSLLIMVGCCLSLSQGRQFRGEPFFWINLGAIAGLAGCIFGWIPSACIGSIPLLNRVGHVATDFSYLLVMNLTIQSAYGFHGLMKIEKFGEGVVDFVCAGAACAGIFLLYANGYAHQPVPWNYFICAAAGAVGAPLLFVFLKSRQQQTLLLGWVGILVLGFIPNFRFGLYNRGNDALLLLPGPRVVLNSPSQAITKIKADNSEPFRIIGWPWNLDGNYAAVYELEDIRSCSPLSNPEFINILRQFPGVEISSFWMIQVADPVKAQPVLNMLNVKYVMAPPDVNLGGKLAFRLVQRSDFGILENLEVWPRAFFVNHVVGIDSNEEFIKYLSQNSREPFASLAPNQIEKHPGLAQLKDNSPPAMIPATHYRLLPNATEFDIHASSAGVVCLTEGQARDFTATANHQPKPVLTVNRAFKGIYLDQPGDYHIQFTYRPRHWRLAVTLFFISWGGVLVLILIKLLRCKNVGNQMRPSVPLTNPN